MSIVWLCCFGEIKTPLDFKSSIKHVNYAFFNKVLFIENFAEKGVKIEIIVLFSLISGFPKTYSEKLYE